MAREPRESIVHFPIILNQQEDLLLLLLLLLSLLLLLFIINLFIFGIKT